MEILTPYSKPFPHCLNHTLQDRGEEYVSIFKTQGRKDSGAARRHNESVQAVQYAVTVGRILWLHGLLYRA